MPKKVKEKIPCPNCGSLNTIKHGMNAAGTQLVGCKDCKKQLVKPKTPLSELKCTYCNKKSVDYKKPANLCKDCYYQRTRDKRKLSYELIDSIMKNPGFLSEHSNVNLEEFTMYLYVLKYRQKRNIDLNKDTLHKYFNAYQNFVQILSNSKAKEIETHISVI